MFQPSNKRNQKKARRGFGMRRETRCLMLGLDASGKTTILYKLKLGEIVNTIPTIGFNVETIEARTAGNFTIWDVGGNSRIRALWRHYLQNTEVVIWVVDSSDAGRFSESKDELHRILGEDELKDARLLVIANKQDLPNAKSVAEVCDAHGLSQIRGRDWFICGACTIDVSQVTDWLFNGSSLIKKKSKPAEEAEKEDEIEERVQLGAQHLLWRTYTYAQKFAGVDYDTGRAVTIGPNATTMPAEVVGRILSYLPMANLVPNGPLKMRFAPVFPQGSWLVNRTFLVCAFTQAAERIARLTINGQRHGERTFSPRAALRALMTTTLPDGLQALHAVVVALMALATSDGPGKAEGAVTMDMRPGGVVAVLDMTKAPPSVRSMFRVLGLFSASVEVLNEGGGVDADHAVGANDDDGDDDGANSDGDDSDTDSDEDASETDAPKFGLPDVDNNSVLKMFMPISHLPASEAFLPMMLDKLAWMRQEFAAGTADYLRLKEIIAEVAPDHATADLVVPSVGVFEVIPKSVLQTSQSTAAAIRTCNFDMLHLPMNSNRSHTSQSVINAALDVISGCASRRAGGGRCRAVAIADTDMSVLKCGVAAVLEGVERGTAVREVAFSLSNEGSSATKMTEALAETFALDPEPTLLARLLIDAKCVFSLEKSVLKIKLPPHGHADK